MKNNLAPLNFIERAIAIFSPKAAANRAYHRFKLANNRKYEAAASGRRTDGWKTDGSSADREIVSSLKVLRNRARAMVRDNPYADNAIETLTNNSVGTGIVPTPVTADEKVRTRLLEAWAEWAETEQIDFDGLVHFYSLQELAVRCVFESGEVLVRKRVVSSKDEYGKKRIPFSIQILEGDYLDHTKSILLLPNGGRIIDGKEYDKEGRAVAYYLFEQHPQDFLNYPVSHRIPASEIIHLFIKKRPGQTRGVPAGASALLRLRDLDDYEDAQLIKQKVSSCYAAFIHDSPDADIPVGGESGDDEKIETLEPGIVETLQPGKSISFANPPSVEGYSDYTKKILQSIAAGYGVTYEAMTRDLSNVNFSSGRMGWLEFHRRMDSFQYNHIIPVMNNRIWKWFLDGGVFMGIIPESDRCRAEWTPPRRQMIDPVKEVKGMEMEVRAGFKSWQQMVRENGYDPIKVIQELKLDKQAFDDAGLMPTSDPRFDATRKIPTVAIDPNTAGSDGAKD